MKIYTGTGDSGRTSLFSGERVAKNDTRIEAYGTVDELNSIIGAVAATLPDGSDSDGVKQQLVKIQSDLFRIGAMLATTADSSATTFLQPVTEEDGRWLEVQIDWMQSRLPDLTEFIIPGGHVSASWAHVARTVCRRAERRILSLAANTNLTEGDREVLLRYINRLSDYLFILARYCNMLAGVADLTWRKRDEAD